MTIQLEAYQRSTHDLSYIFRTTQAPGTLVPFMVQVGLPGDTFDIDLNANVLTHPTLGPLFGSFKLQLDVFQAPVRLYHSALLQNLTQIGNNMQNVLLPLIESDDLPAQTGSTVNIDTAQINPSALLAYLGIRGWGLNTSGAGGHITREMNAIPLLAYWEIYRNYYANKQEEVGYQLVPAPPLNGTVTSVTLDGNTIPQDQWTEEQGSTEFSVLEINFTGDATTILPNVLFNTSIGVIRADKLILWNLTSPGVYTSVGELAGTPSFTFWEYANPDMNIGLNQFPLTNIDDMKQRIFASAPTAQAIIGSGNEAPYGPSINLGFTTASQCGLAIKTYQSDLFNNWMQTTWYQDIQTKSAVDTSAGHFNVDALILARKVYDLLNRIAVSGGTYWDWINAAYDHEPYQICNTPVYEGGLSKEIVFQQVVSTAETDNQPLATLAGRGTLNQKHKGGKIRIKVNEHSYLIGIVSITPRLDYSQGNEWHTYGIKTMDDFHKPALDQIGFQQLITEQMAWWDTIYDTKWEQKSAGYQPAWINYMTNYNKCYGNFAIPTNEMFMTLNRRYEQNPATLSIVDVTTYIDPSKYNFIFAQTSLDAQNFWTQIAVDITARRKMSAKVMPSL